MIDSRKIEDLHPRVQELCRKFIKECKKNGIEVVITATFRDNEFQDSLYAQGRTKPGKKVTNAKGGQSMHNYRVAFDFVPLKNGKADWNDLNKFNQCGKIAQMLGLEWGGAWTSFKDRPHCQYTGGLTLKDFQNGKTFN